MFELVTYVSVLQKLHPKDELNHKAAKIDADDEGEDFIASQHLENSDGTMHNSEHEKGKKKRKRKQVKDLRFEAEMEKLTGLSSKRRERKKK